MDDSGSGSLMFVQVVFAIIVRQSIKAYLTLSGITGIDCALSWHFTYAVLFLSGHLAGTSAEDRLVCLGIRLTRFEDDKNGSSYPSLE